MLTLVRNFLMLRILNHHCLILLCYVLLRINIAGICVKHILPTWDLEGLPSTYLLKFVEPPWVKKVSTCISTSKGNVELVDSSIPTASASCHCSCWVCCVPATVNLFVDYIGSKCFILDPNQYNLHHHYLLQDHLVLLLGIKLVAGITTVLVFVTFFLNLHGQH